MAEVEGATFEFSVTTLLVDNFTTSTMEAMKVNAAPPMLPLAFQELSIPVGAIGQLAMHPHAAVKIQRPRGGAREVSYVP